MTQAPEGARQAFEAWATSRNYTLLRSQDAGYTNPSIAVAWQAYQAALASVASPATAQAAEGWRAELIRKVELLSQEEPAYDEEGYCLNPDAAELRDDLIASFAAPAAAEGWKMVPIEPTDAMLEAWLNTWEKLRTDLADCYAELLAASPEPPYPAAPTDGTWREGMEAAIRLVEGGSFLHAESPPAQFARQVAKALREEIRIADSRRKAALAVSPVGQPAAPTVEQVKDAATEIAIAVAKNCGSVPNLTFPHIYLGLKDFVAKHWQKPSAVSPVEPPPPEMPNRAIDCAGSLCMQRNRCSYAPCLSPSRYPPDWDMAAAEPPQAPAPSDTRER